MAELGLAIRVDTAGKKLRVERVRRALLNSAVAVRFSVDAVREETFQRVHAASGLEERLDAIRHLVSERDGSGSDTLIGAHFVIQRDSWDEIVPFAEQTRRLGCDFVSYSTTRRSLAMCSPAWHSSGPCRKRSPTAWPSTSTASTRAWCGAVRATTGVWPARP
ncbi:hypothetical protein GCM10027091_51540 [Streptomyces daliensis]